jgi:ferritin-like metal-binding protein YciE
MLIEQLKSVYCAELHLLRTLPRLARQASPDRLRLTLEAVTGRIQGQAAYLEEALAILGQKPKGRNSGAIDILLQESSALLDGAAEPAAEAAALIGFFQKVVHYGIASYASMAAWAEHLRLQEVAHLLRETLADKEEAEKWLREYAQTQFDAEVANGRSRSTEPESRALNGLKGRQHASEEARVIRGDSLERMEHYAWAAS